MKKSGSPEDKSPSEVTDAGMKEPRGWQDKMLARLRALVHEADPEVIEEWKDGGFAVWSHDGVICTGETYKTVVKMTFPEGAFLKDPSGLFNRGLERDSTRAVDFQEGRQVNEEALKTLIRAAVAWNHGHRPCCHDWVGHGYCRRAGEQGRDADIYEWYKCAKCGAYKDGWRADYEEPPDDEKHGGGGGKIW